GGTVRGGRGGGGDAVVPLPQDVGVRGERVQALDEERVAEEPALGGGGAGAGEEGEQGRERAAELGPALGAGAVKQAGVGGRGEPVQALAVGGRAAGRPEQPVQNGELGHGPCPCADPSVYKSWSASPR